MNIDSPVCFDARFSDYHFSSKPISRQQADQLFLFFQQHPLFRWHDSNNGCEGRADAVCVLLDEWKIPNAKAWIFGGNYLKKSAGQLIQYWNYHVAPVLPVEENGAVVLLVLDPSTLQSLQTVESWATTITSIPTNFYGLRESHWYIFPAQDLETRKWHSRDKRNRKWMIQALANINGLSAYGKSKLVFNKKLLRKVATAFASLRYLNPLQ